jgi:3-oxoadipate enol-lactonase
VWLADQTDRARAIDVPTLVLCGSDDKVTPPALSHELAALIPGALYVEIDRSGHLSNLERPEQFNRAVEEFIGNGRSLYRRRSPDGRRQARRRA